ncbi:hypothetical protein JCM8547_007447 [Rhodosporidiobolus lusitaniae]
MPSNANETEGPCCVCGTTTTQRCGACQEAGFDLFFCSKEHQKWVWFALKRVCGKNAKPFTFPPLTIEEAKQLKAGFGLAVCWTALRGTSALLSGL